MLSRRPRCGVTLIEVNLAMGVLLFGILSVASLFPTGLKLAEYGFRATDAALIASMARSQLELLSRSKAFVYPKAVPPSLRSEPREARLKESAPQNTRGTYNALVCKPLDGDDNQSVGWTPNVWARAYVLITSGAEEGRVFSIVSNSSSSITIAENAAGLNLRANDSLRIIYNKKGTKCIPENFLRLGVRIPTINAIEMERVEPNVAIEDITLDTIANDTARQLQDKRTGDGRLICRYSYAILLDSPEPDNPELYRAYVLVYKDFDPDLGGKWWQNNPPVEYYPFFYRKPPADLGN